MNLIIDIGNTQFKICVFDNEKLVYHTYTDIFDQDFFNKLKNEYRLTNCIYSDTRGVNQFLFESIFKNNFKALALNYNTPLPIKIEYETPKTLGKDRIAGAVGANALFTEQPCLIIDIGTAITIDLVDEFGVFKGGIISPGPETRFKSLHHFTGKLPLVEPVEKTKKLGFSTESAIQFGVQNGILYEINGYISRYMEQYPNINILLTGGYAYLFDKKINYPIFADSFLVPKGLNRILIYNELYK